MKLAAKKGKRRTSVCAAGGERIRSTSTGPRALRASNEPLRWTAASLRPELGVEPSWNLKHRTPLCQASDLDGVGTRPPQSPTSSCASWRCLRNLRAAGGGLPEWNPRTAAAGPHRPPRSVAGDCQSARFGCDFLLPNAFVHCRRTTSPVSRVPVGRELRPSGRSDH